MALPGETGSLFPAAYLTKVPQKIQRREDQLVGAGTGSDGGSAFSAGLCNVPAKLIMHEDEALYFDYGAVRLGRNPKLEDPSAAKPVCVGLGWLPGWAFTMSERGLPDIVPASHPPPATADHALDEHVREDTGVLGLLYKLQLQGQPASNRSLFQKKTAVDFQDLVYARATDWDATIHFHENHKLVKQTEVYIHLVDGGLGHRHQKDGNVMPFRTPGWPVRAVVHVDPSREQLIRTKETKVAERCIQGDWVAKELVKWVKDAGLPQAYVEDALQEWLVADPGTGIKRPLNGRTLKKFLGFS